MSVIIQFRVFQKFLLTVITAALLYPFKRNPGRSRPVRIVIYAAITGYSSKASGVAALSQQQLFLLIVIL